MNPAAPISGRARPVIRAVTVALGIAVIVYAATDDPFLGGEPGFGSTQMLIAIIGAGLCLSAALPLRWNGRVLASFISLGVTLFVCEWVVERTLGPRYRPPFAPHPRYIFSLLPDREGHYVRTPENGGQRIVYRINADGYRGRDVDTHRSGLRVVVYGDSFIQAIFSEEADTYTQTLEKEIATTTGGPVQVINAGVASYGPDQICLRMEDELGRLCPDLVIVSIFAGNDFGDLERNKLFRLDDSGRLVENPYILSPEVRNWFLLSQRESILKRVFKKILPGADHGGLAQRPPVARLEAWLQEAEREHRDFVLDRSDLVTNTHQDHYNADVSLTPRSASATFRKALMAAVMGRIAEAARSSGTTLVFMFIPHPMDACEGSEYGAVDTSRFPDYRRDNATEALTAIARSLGTHHVDLFATFSGHRADELYLIGGDDHWNEAGQALAARATLDLLRDQGLLERRGR
jgi:hypothetical protein